MLEQKNAVIKSARITNDDHGLLTAWLDLDYGGSGQGFGGWSLYLPQSFTHHKMLSPAGHFLWRCMEVAGVERWDQMAGKTIRVRAEHSKVEAIGHIIKDDWFCPSDDFKQEPSEGLHPRTADLVDRFAAALKEKLSAAEKKYGYTDGWLDNGWMDECREKLAEHIAKGDPRDVAAYCAFLWHHNERTTA